MCITERLSDEEEGQPQQEVIKEAEQYAAHLIFSKYSTVYLTTAYLNPKLSPAAKRQLIDMAGLSEGSNSLTGMNSQRKRVAHKREERLDASYKALESQLKAITLAKQKRYFNDKFA